MTVLLSLLLLVHVIALTMDFVIDRALTNSPGDIASTPLSSINGYSGLKGATLALEYRQRPDRHHDGRDVAGLVLAGARERGDVRPGTHPLLRGDGGRRLAHPRLQPLRAQAGHQRRVDGEQSGLPQWYGYGPRPTSRRGLVNGWWTMWLIYFVFGTFSSYESWYDAGSVEDGQETLALALFTDIFSIPAIDSRDGPRLPADQNPGRQARRTVIAGSDCGSRPNP